MNVILEAKPDMIPHHQNLLLLLVKVNDKDYWVMEKYSDSKN